MKKKIIVSLVMVIILIFFFAIFTYSNQYDFRKTNWGISEDQVKATEDKTPNYEDNTALGQTLGYEVKIGKKDYYCIYYFLEDKLYNSGYLFAGEHTNENDYIQDYKEIKELLTKKYGETNKKKLKSLYNREEVYWKDDLFKNDRSNWGLAISIGDLSYASIWETPTTEIELILDGDNYKISLRIKYISKELKEWANKILEEKAKSSF